MFKENKIFKVINKKYYINEYIYTIKSFENSFMVLVMDLKSNKFYIEDSYPLELLNSSRIKEVAKSDFYSENKEVLIEYISPKYPDLYKNLSIFQVQKSLF